MNRQAIERFVMRYLEATGCQVMERTDSYVTVKFSPEADKDLTNRSYYWNFVERTGAPAETMSFTFVFDPEAYQTSLKAAAANKSAGAPSAQNTILGRCFGIAPGAGTSLAGPGRIPSDTVTFGSRRLEQLFDAVLRKGRFVRLFEEPKSGKPNPFASIGYSTWLGVNYKVEFICDMKRDELHSLAIHLGTGQIAERFFDAVRSRVLTPKLPSNVHLQPVRMSVDAAVNELESHLYGKIQAYDHRWADEAFVRLAEEQSRIDRYFADLLRSAEADEEKAAAIREQYRNREQEIDWQYRPRIQASVISCGFFHLCEGLRAPIDAAR